MIKLQKVLFFKRKNGKLLPQLYVIIVLCSVMAGCEAHFFNSGTQITQSKEVAPFRFLLIEDIFDLELIQADTFGVAITTGKELLNNIKLRSSGDSLFIKNNNSARWSRRYEHPKIRVHFPDIEKITLHEPCRMQTIDTLKLDRFTLWAIAEVSETQLCIKANYLRVVNASTSAGKYEVTGKVRTYSTWMRSSGILEARHLEAEQVTLRSQSIGDCYIWATKKLDVTIENSGYVYYMGAPEITLTNEQNENQLIPLE